MKIPFTNIHIVRNNVGRGHYTSKGDAPVLAVLQNQGLRVAPTSLWAVYRMNGDVYACVREWRQSTGSSGYRFAAKSDREVPPPAQEMSRATQFFSRSGGIEKVKNQMVTDLGVCGNFYGEIRKSKDGGFHSIKRLDPRGMYVVADVHGNVLKYAQRVPGYGDVVFEPQDILHVVLDDDPDNTLLGMSPLESILWEARTDIASSQSNYFFFENDAVPAHLYLAEKGIEQNELNAVMDQIRDSFSGAKNKHKSAMLQGIREIVNVSISQKDMEFVVGRKFNTQKVCAAFGVPPFILGYTESVNQNNGEGMTQKYYLGTIRPLEMTLESAFDDLMQRIGLTQTTLFFLPQSFGDQMELDRLALEEYKIGVLTLRQYKIKTGQEITAEDESEPMIDRHIIQGGASAVLMEDVGVTPVADE